MIYAFGDSYAAYSSNVFQGRDRIEGIDPNLERDLLIKKTKSYIDHVSDYTQQKIGHLGNCGRGPLDMVQQFFDFDREKILEEDILIFCWSGMERDIDKWGDPYIDPKYDNTRYEGDDMQRYKDAVKLYHLFLASPMQHKQSMLSSLLAIDGMLDKVKTKNIFHFSCFEHELAYINEHYKFANGHYETEWCLFDHARTFDDYGVDGVDDLEYPCHYSPKGSIGLANYIYEKVIK